jgi:hypothetical protein
MSYLDIQQTHLRGRINDTSLSSYPTDKNNKLERLSLVSFSNLV